MPDNDQPGESFVGEWLLSAPPDRVFAAWTRRDELVHWFGPTGVEITAATLDLRPGGTFHYCMRLPDGGEMWGKWTFREIERPSRLVSVVTFSDKAGGDARAPFDPNWPLHTLSVLSFERRGDETLLRLKWSPLDASAEERQVFAAGQEGMRQGWAGTVARLEAYLGSER